MRAEFEICEVVDGVWSSPLARFRNTLLYTGGDLLAAMQVAALPMPDPTAKGSYAVKPLTEWQQSQQPKLPDLPAAKPVTTNYPVLDLEKWRELHQHQEEEKRKTGEKWTGQGWKSGDGE